MAKKHFTSILNEPEPVHAPSITKAAVSQRDEPVQPRNPNIRQAGRPRVVEPGGHKILVQLTQDTSDILTRMVALRFEGVRSIREATNLALTFYGSMHPILLKPLTDK